MYSLVSYFKNYKWRTEAAEGNFNLLVSLPEMPIHFSHLPSCICLHGLTNNTLTKKGGEKEEKGDQEETWYFKTPKAFFPVSDLLNLYWFAHIPFRSAILTTPPPLTTHYWCYTHMLQALISIGQLKNCNSALSSCIQKYIRKQVSVWWATLTYI